MLKTYTFAKVFCVSDVNINDHKAVIEFCKEHDVQLAVIGPEDPLAAGIADVLNAAGKSGLVL